MARLAGLLMPQQGAPSLTSLIEGRREREKQSKLAELLSGAYGAEGGNRQALLQQMIATDPTMGMNAAKMLDPRMQASENGMFAQKVGEDGFIYNAMRDGRMVNTGIKADRQMWFRDNPGMSPELVGKDGNVRPVGYGAPQAQPMPQGQQPFDIRYDGPEEDRAVFEQLAAADAAQPFANGNYSATLPDRNVTPQQRAWTQNTPSPYGNGFTPAQAKPAMSAAQAAADLRAEQANARAEEAAARVRETAGMGSIPQGMRLVNGRLERIPGMPDPATTNKVNAAVAAKVPQLQNAIRGLGRIDTALEKLNGRFVNTGPMDAKFQRFTKEGQELDAAVGAIQNSVLALTRVPGVGSQSDLEARMAALQYPSLDKHPDVNKRTAANLKLFMRDLAQAYKIAVNQGGAASDDGLNADEQEELAELRARLGR